MPYSNEKASRLGHVPTANNQAVQDALSRWKVSHARPSDDAAVKKLCVPVSSLANPGVSDDVQFSLTVDGSDSEVQATREHPSVKVGYLRVAGSLLDLRKLASAADGPFVDSSKLRQSYNAYTFDAALPGAGLVRPGMGGKDTWREEVSAFLASTHFDDDSNLTLADALLTLHGSPGQAAADVPIRVCPSCREDFGAGKEPRVGASGGSCPECNAVLHMADILRTHDEYQVEGSNQTALTRLMVMSERLMLLSYLEHFYSQVSDPLDLLRRVIFVADGPLALFGTVAPLKRRFQEYHDALYSWAHQQGSLGPLMVGVEKNGRFWDHAEQVRDLVPVGHVMMLTDAYINDVAGHPSSHQYGVDEFYGRRFFYRTTAGDLLVITVPPGPGVVPYGGAASEDFASYPTLRPTCEVLDRVRTRLYPDAVIPVALAHNAAALPLGVGQSVLRALAQQALGLPTTHQIRSSKIFKPL